MTRIVVYDDGALAIRPGPRGVEVSLRGGAWTPTFYGDLRHAEAVLEVCAGADDAWDALTGREVPSGRPVPS